MSDRAKTANLDCGEHFLGSKYFPESLTRTCQAVDPNALLFGPPSTLALPLPAIERERLRHVFDDRISGKKLLLCSGGDDALVPYANAKPFVDVLKDATKGWYKDGNVLVDDRVYKGVGHRFSKGMVEDAVRFLVGVLEDGHREKSDKSKI